MNPLTRCQSPSILSTLSVCALAGVLLSSGTEAFGQILLPFGSDHRPVVAGGSPIVISVNETAQPAAAETTKPIAVRSSDGPWGGLEYFPVFMEAPGYLVEHFPMPASKTRWAFPAAKEREVPSFLESAGLTAAEVAAVLTAPGKISDGQNVYLFPPNSLVETLAPPVRARIYHELRRLPENEFQYEPVLITSGDVESWFRTSGISPQVVASIKKMAYRRGDCLAFSDVPVLLDQAATEAEGRSILKALTRTQTLVVKLLLGAGTDITKLMDYWTTGLNLRRKDIEPMLLSVVATQGADKLDIVHLLPPLPRKLLMTYPDVSMGLNGIFPDCHWTSLNFFNYNPQPYLLDSRLATSAVLERFETVKVPYKFGDILFFLDAKTGDAYHSCIYVADDIVFTKNGRNVLSPWVLTKIETVRQIYLFDGNGRIQGYRNKKGAAKANQLPSDGP